MSCIIRRACALAFLFGFDTGTFMFRSGTLLHCLFVTTVEPGFVGERVIDDFFRFEVEGDFVFRTLGAVGAVDEVIPPAGAEIAANGTRFGLVAEGFAHHFPAHVDHALGLQHHHQNRRGGQIFDHAFKERFAFMDSVMFAGQFQRDSHEFGGDNLEALLFEARQNKPDEVSLHRIGLDNN